MHFFYCCLHAFKLWFIYITFTYFISFLFLFLFSLQSVSQGPMSLLPLSTLQIPANVSFLLLRHTCLAQLISQTGVLIDYLLSLYVSSSYFPGLNLFRSVQNLLIHSSDQKNSELHSLAKNSSQTLSKCLSAY